MSNVLIEEITLTNRWWLLDKTLENFQKDVELCERGEPSHGLLGTLKVNMEVCRKNLDVATPEQLDQFFSLEERALKFLNP